MTKAEAKAMLKRIQEPEAWEPQINQAAFEALDMAIEALSSSEIPNSSDTISRQAAIDLLHMHLMYRMGTDSNKKRLDDWINGVPSVQPESKWILCSERLPDEHEWLGTKKFGTTISNEVYVTFEAPDGQRFAKHISFQNGKLSPVDEQCMKVWFKGAKPIAWMPLPEPYQAERREE